jgi:hypothetical protein
MRQPLRALLFLSLSAALSLSGAPVRAATYEVVGPVRLAPAGATAGTAVLTLRGEGIAATDKAPQPLDLGIPDRSVTIDTAPLSEETPSATSRIWKYKVTVSQLAAQALQTRFLRLAEGVPNRSYELTNRPAETFTWTVSGPPAELALGWKNEASVGIVTGPVATRSAGLSAVQLTEESTKRPLRLKLCKRAPDGQPARWICARHFSLAPHQVARLFLRADAAASPGIYRGSITLTSPDLPAGQKGEQFSLTAYVTSPVCQALGVVAIALGVGLAWWATQYAQRRIAHAQALLPAAALRERLADLEKRLPDGQSAFAGDTPAIRNRISEVRSELSDATLARLLPSPFNPLSTATPSGEYQAHLTAQAAVVGLLAVVVREGIEPVLALWQQHQAPAQHLAGVLGHLRTIDGEAARQAPIDLAAVRTVIQAEVDAVDALLNPPALGVNNALGGPAAAPGRPQVSSEDLLTEITVFGGSIWLIWGMVAVVAGSGALVFSNPGFGVPLDFIKCLLWGFGLPAAGQQLTALTAGSVRTSLGIAVPTVR